MADLTPHAVELLAQLDISQVDLQWVIDQIEGLHNQFDTSPWSAKRADAPHTQAQIGYLAGLMDLDRDDRLMVLEIITGIDTEWDTSEDYPGSDVEKMETPEAYPGRSSKDLRITRWMTSVLIEYYLNGDGNEFNQRLGLIAASVKRQEKRAQRLANQAAQATLGI